MRTRAVVLAGLVSLLAAVAAAQDPTPAPSPTALAVAKLMTGENFEMTMAQMLQALRPALKAVLEAELKRPATDEEQRGVVAAFQRSFELAFPRTLLEEETARVLTRHFTEPELDELLRFQQSPLGAKMRGLSRTVMLEAERIFKSRQQLFGEHLRAELRRELGRPAQ